MSRTNSRNRRPDPADLAQRDRARASLAAMAPDVRARAIAAARAAYRAACAELDGCRPVPARPVEPLGYDARGRPVLW